MQALLIASIASSTIIGTIVGLKLLRLAYRTRQLPEFAVGAGLFCYAAIGQVFLFAIQAVGDDAPHALRMTLLAVRLSAFYLALIGLSTFTWRVFGPTSTWRKAMTIFLAVFAVATFGASYYAAAHRLAIDGALPLYARFGGAPQFTILFAWTSLESLRYHGHMRKRQALGLADPIVTNRFEVWGISSAISGTLLVGLMVVMFRSQSAQLGADPLGSGLVSAAGLVNATGWWLTFIPPATYTSWVKNRAASRARGA